MTALTESLVIIDSHSLENQSKGIRFAIPALGEFATGFVIRYEGKPYAYVNQCAHVPIELDWNQGEFFTTEKDYLICATHGAHYLPDTGYCVLGPCKGKQLKVIPLVEINEKIEINIATLLK